MEEHSDNHEPISPMVILNRLIVRDKSCLSFHGCLTLNSEKLYGGMVLAHDSGLNFSLIQLVHV